MRKTIGAEARLRACLRRTLRKLYSLSKNGAACGRGWYSRTLVLYGSRCEDIGRKTLLGDSYDEHQDSNRRIQRGTEIVNP